MAHKYFNFLYIPGGNTEPRPIRLRKSLARGFVAVCVVGIAAGIYGSIRFSRLVQKTYRLSTLERENGQLREQIGQINESVTTLRRQVAQNFDFQKKARILAQLDEIGEGVAQVGIGGPDYPYIQAVSYIDPSTRERLTKVRTDVDKLLRQSRLQRQGYEDIVATFTESDKRLRCTPTRPPIEVGYITSRFGHRMDPITGRRSMHRGVDFSARKGTPVFAPADGVVTYSGRWKTYGNVVELSHGYDLVTRYAHLEKQLVVKGQRVKRGDVIARVGSTGKSTFSHLHYEIEDSGKRIDPLRYIVPR